ncbi:hypothetical protein HR12_03565 [Microbacterium sp. SUBG005]|nr:hypothetical protein HR12_03565 [Microbacterium sp. SUBG005]
MYAPEAFALTLRGCASDDLDVRVYDLAARRPDAARWSTVDGGVRLAQPEFPGDALYVIRGLAPVGL